MLLFRSEFVTSCWFRFENVLNDDEEGTYSHNIYIVVPRDVCKCVARVTALFFDVHQIAAGFIVSTGSSCAYRFHRTDKIYYIYCVPGGNAGQGVVVHAIRLLYTHTAATLHIICILHRPIGSEEGLNALAPFVRMANRPNIALIYCYSRLRNKYWAYNSPVNICIWFVCVSCVWWAIVGYVIQRYIEGLERGMKPTKMILLHCRQCMSTAYK